MNKQDITKLLDNQNKLVELDACVDIYNDRIKEQRLEKMNLDREINALITKIENYEGISQL